MGNKQKPVNWNKKLKEAYNQGFGEGAEATHEVWTKVCERTPGVGAKTQAKLLENARIMLLEWEIGKNEKNLKNL